MNRGKLIRKYPEALADQAQEERRLARARGSRNGHGPALPDGNRGVQEQVFGQGPQNLALNDLHDESGPGVGKTDRPDAPRPGVRGADLEDRGIGIKPSGQGEIEAPPVLRLFRKRP